MTGYHETELRYSQQRACGVLRKFCVRSPLKTKDPTLKDSFATNTTVSDVLTVPAAAERIRQQERQGSPPSHSRRLRRKSEAR